MRVEGTMSYVTVLALQEGCPHTIWTSVCLYIQYVPNRKRRKTQSKIFMRLFIGINDLWLSPFHDSSS